MLLRYGKVPMDYLEDYSALAHFYVTCSLEQLLFLKRVLGACGDVARVGWRARLSSVVHPQTEERRLVEEVIVRDAHRFLCTL